MSGDDTPLPGAASPEESRPGTGRDRQRDLGTGRDRQRDPGVPVEDDLVAAEVEDDLVAADVEDDLLAAAAQLRPALRRDALPLSTRDTLRDMLIAGRAELNRQRATAARPLIIPDPSGGPDVVIPDPSPAGVSRPIAALPQPRRTGRIPRRVAAWGSVTLLVAASSAVVLALSRGTERGAVPVAASTNLDDVISSDPASAITVRFSQPLDHASVDAGLHLTPAVRFRSTWQGETLTVAPVHGFASNTAYLISVDKAMARTASGKPLTADITVGFGTARAATAGPATAGPVGLSRLLVAQAAADSEAVVLRDGTLLLTAASSPASASTSPALLRVRGGVATRMGPAVDAICVSRSGASVAYLHGSGPSAQIVLADAAGDPKGQVRVNADPETPLGWIADAEVTFVSGGQLQAVDRSGRVRVLSRRPVDAAADGLTIAPGGRYAYHATRAGAGEVIDLRTGRGHPLPAITGTPAFSADGATVSWVQGSGGGTRLATAPSGGGPVLSMPLPVRSAETISDLAASPTGALLAYTVRRADGRSELRVASRRDGRTVGVSELGPGESPNWRPSGDGFTVLGRGPHGPQIQVIPLPDSLLSRRDAMASVVRGFVDAQIDGDLDAQRALASGGVVLPAVARVTRAEVIQVSEGPGATGTALVRLTADATSTLPAIRQVEETIQLAGSGGVPQVAGVSLGAFGPAPQGPQLTAVDTGARPGVALLSFDSDLDPATVSEGVTLASAEGTSLAAVTQYDATTRTVTVRPVDAPPSGISLTVRLTGALRDVAGHRLASPRSIPLSVD